LKFWELRKKWANREIEKGNAALRQQVFDGEALGLAARYLREAAGLTLQQVRERIERQSGVKISLSTLSQFENGVPRSLRQEKIDALIAFHDCATPQEMIEKGNAAVPPHGRALGLAERYLRKESRLTQQQIVDGMERQSGVKISRQALQQFESGVPSIGQEKIDALIAFHGCATPQEMIDKADRAAAYLFDDAGKLKSKPAGEALTHTLRRILDQPFHPLEKLAAERDAQENLKERGR
jgi:transcriptional regulator with XRE-family HTH domain